MNNEITISQLAAIDIGSNAMRLLINYIYEYQGKTDFVKAQLIRMPIRLGHDVFLTGRVSEENEKRMVHAMKAYKHTMAAYQVEDYLAFATSAMREAANGEEIAEKLRKESGVNVQIINGSKEADIIFATELNDYVNSHKNYLYVDVGGGSTELTLLANGKVEASRSFKIGTVRLLHGKTKPDVFEGAMKEWLNQHLDGLEVELIGSGGNINHLYKRSGLKDKEPLEIGFVNQMRKEITPMSFADRLTKMRMKPDRADVFEHALNIFYHVMKWSNSKHIFVPKIGLADGMIQHLYREKSS